MSDDDGTVGPLFEVDSSDPRFPAFDPDVLTELLAFGEVREVAAGPSSTVPVSVLSHPQLWGRARAQFATSTSTGPRAPDQVADGQR